MNKFIICLIASVSFSANAAWVSIGKVGGLISAPNLACHQRFVSSIVSPSMYLYPRSVSQSGNSTYFKIDADPGTLFWATYSSVRNVYTPAMAAYNGVTAGAKTIYLYAQVGSGLNWFGINVDFTDANGNPAGRGFGVSSDVWAATAIEENCN